VPSESTGAAPSNGTSPGVAFDVKAHANESAQVSDVAAAANNADRRAVNVQTPNNVNNPDVPDGSVSDHTASSYVGADEDDLATEGAVAENDSRSILTVAAPGDYLTVSLVSFAGSQELAPLGAGELVDLAAFPELAEVAALVEYLEQVIDWAGAEEARSWLPWLVGAGLTAAAAEITRRQLRRREEDEVSPYRQLLASGQLV
jgi:hypothetical protein